MPANKRLREVPARVPKGLESKKHHERSEFKEHICTFVAVFHQRWKPEDFSRRQKAKTTNRWLNRESSWPSVRIGDATGQVAKAYVAALRNYGEQNSHNCRSDVALRPIF